MTDADPVRKIVFLVRDGQRCTQSYTWRIWSHGTSFYIAPRWVSLASFKVSLHGPRGNSRSLWKIELDRTGEKAALAAGGAVIRRGAGSRLLFRGRNVAAGVRLAVRIRNPWTAFHRGSPCGPHPGDVRPKDVAISTHGVIRPPEQLRYVDVDLYVSENGRPYWPWEAELIRENAKLGWLVNDAGQHLTVAAFDRGLRDRTPKELELPRPSSDLDVTRAIGAHVLKNFALLDEQIASASAFT